MWPWPNISHLPLEWCEPPLRVKSLCYQSVFFYMRIHKWYLEATGTLGNVFVVSSEMRAHNVPCILIHDIKDHFLTNSTACAQDKQLPKRELQPAVHRPTCYGGLTALEKADKFINISDACDFKPDSCQTCGTYQWFQHSGVWSKGSVDLIEASLSI